MSDSLPESGRTAAILKRIGTLLIAAVLTACAGQISVLNRGLGEGRVLFSPSETPCGPEKVVCKRSVADDIDITLTAEPLPDSDFIEWDGACSGTSLTCTVRSDAKRLIEARFEPQTALPSPTAAQLTGASLQNFLNTNSSVGWDAPKFLAAIGSVANENYLDNWIFMARSDSLQTAHAKMPRLLLPNGDASRVFAFSLGIDPAWPGADPDVVEYLEWDVTQSRFRFHEIELATGTVHQNKAVCQQCHAGRPNWDSYDFWGGMVPSDRDRVYKGSVDAAALRKILNIWQEMPPSMRSIIEQLNLPVGPNPADPLMSRVEGGAFHGTIQFKFDDDPITLVEAPVADWGTTGTVSVNYPSGTPSDVIRGGENIVLKSNPPTISDQGRGVDLFDRLTLFNGKRIGQELVDFPRNPIDVRPIALAILNCNPADLQTAIGPAIFNVLTQHHAASSLQVIIDTRRRRERLPKLKADEQIQTLSGTFGTWRAYSATVPDGGGTETVNGNRQQIFRHVPTQANDTITGFSNDFEDYTQTKIFDFRWYLEPVGVPVDKWSMSVGGKSRTYTFADQFDIVEPGIRAAVGSSLGNTSSVCTNSLRSQAAAELGRLQAPSSLPTPSFSDVQEIFDRNCLHCHGNFTVNGTAPAAPNLIPGSAHGELTGGSSPVVVPFLPTASRLMTRLTSTTNPMPPEHDGPPLSRVHIEVIRRWIAGGANP